MRRKATVTDRLTVAITVDDEDEGHLMDRSIGSDGERSDSQGSPPLMKCAKLERTETNKELTFSIANILSPSFGKQPTLKSKHALRCLSISAAAAIAPGGLSFNSPRSPTTSLSSPEPTTPFPLTPGSPNPGIHWPAWVYCTRYSDRPSPGPRCRKPKQKSVKIDEKRPRTAFTPDQLARLKSEFQENPYLTEKRRQDLSNELGLKESQIKIWFQNKRAKLKKQSGGRSALALRLMAQGLYNHATIPGQDSSDEDGDILGSD